MEVDAYLERIGYRGSREPNAGTLQRIHRAHLLSVPFENLDITLGRPILLSLPSIYRKIVQRGRGGFCYELNGLFGSLLEQLGFTVTILSARVFDGTALGPDFDHLLLLVHLKERWIADVGFGDSFREPLRLDVEEEDRQHGVSYRLRGSDSEKVLQQRKKSAWTSQYVFSLTPRELPEFRAMCHYQQTSPESNFTRKTVCSRATPEGRITLSNNRLITTTGKLRVEREVGDEEEYRALLEAHFGVNLGEGVQTSRFLK